MFGTLETGGTADFKAFAVNEKKVKVPVRICVKKKTPEQIAQAMKRLHSRERKRTVTPEARLFNEYFVAVTSLDDSVTAEQILETYKLRWQVEIYFKRLKSILNFGELPKKNPDSSLAWLTGKLMVALLMESVIAGLFSPQEKLKYYDLSEYLA
jgi:IS4 transposase